MTFVSPPASGRLHQQADFVLFLVARLAAVLAMQMQAVVVAWQVYDRTGDPLALAWAGLAQFIPMLLLLLPAGDLVDRYSRKRLMMASVAVMALCSALLLWASRAPLAAVYAVLALFGAGRAFLSPSLSSLLPQIVPRERLPQAISVNAMVMKFATISGPLLGGLLYAVSGEVVYAVCCAAFVLSVLTLIPLRVRYAEPPAVGESRAVQRFFAGIRFIRTRPIILGAISLDLFAVLLGGVVALLPVYASEVLDVGSTGLGVLRSVVAVGALAMGLYLSLRPLQRRVGRTMFVAVAVFGVANLVFSLSHWFWLSAAMMLLAGAADMISVNVRMTLIQLATPDAMRGRVNAVNMLFIGSSNELGEFRAGTFASAAGTVTAAVGGSLATLAVVGLWAKVFPVLRKVDRFDDVEARPVAGGH